VSSLLAAPDDNDARWLAQTVTGGDLDRARWELRYARWALGLLVAERDSLDDRTGSLVARALSEALLVDRNIAAGMVRVATRQFNDRLAVYRHALMIRGAAEGTAARLGRALLQNAGAAHLSADDIKRAGEILSRYVTESNEALRRAFGAAALPEGVPPSAIGGGGSRGAGR
jgi:hypothetical protein